MNGRRQSVYFETIANDNIASNLEGTPLDELILFDSNRFEGMILNENSIPNISTSIYEKLTNHKQLPLKIQNSELAVYIYSLCKVDDFVFLNVWEIITYPFNQERWNWENQYRRVPYSCCKQNYQAKNSLPFDPQEVLSVPSEILEKNCAYNNSYIECETHVFSHLFNFTGQDCAWFEKDAFGLRVEPDFRVASGGKKVLFRYNKSPVSIPINCVNFYDSIVFDNTTEPVMEHNFQNFLSDALFTCFSYQREIKNGDIRLEEQRLVCVTISF